MSSQSLCVLPSGTKEEEFFKVLRLEHLVETGQELPAGIKKPDVAKMRRHVELFRHLK